MDLTRNDNNDNCIKMISIILANFVCMSVSMLALCLFCVFVWECVCESLCMCVHVCVCVCVCLSLTLSLSLLLSLSVQTNNSFEWCNNTKRKVIRSTMCASFFREFDTQTDTDRQTDRLTKKIWLMWYSENPLKHWKHLQNIFRWTDGPTK